MKTLKYIYLFAFIALAFASCKQDEWIDWKLQNEIWMEQNAKQTDIVTTPTGLQYKVIYQGNQHDAKPSTGSNVMIDYTCSLINGVDIETSQNSVFTLNKGELIDGFIEGLKRMNVGGDYILYIPWELAYGKDGSQAAEQSTVFIPPYSAIIYTIHLSAVNK